MKKKLLTLFAVMLLVSGCAFAKPKQQNLDVLPLFSSQSNQANRLWVGTFQLAWNDLMDGIVKGPVLFTGKTPSVVKQLNNQDFKAGQLSENSYYKTYGETSPELKKAIEEGLLSEERLISYKKLQKELAYSELKSKMAEKEKIKNMFGSTSAMGKIRKQIKNKNKRR